MADVIEDRRKSKELRAINELHALPDSSAEHRVLRKLDLHMMPLFFVLCKYFQLRP